MARMHLTTLLLLCWICSLSALTHAQFGFFDQMFGQGGQQQQQQQQRPRGGQSQWAAQADLVQCSEYLCPNTLLCVSNPADCPCPNVEDHKCLVPDGQDKDAATVLCVRGPGCGEVERLMKRRG